MSVTIFLMTSSKQDEAVDVLWFSQITKQKGQIVVISVKELKRYGLLIWILWHNNIKSGVFLLLFFHIMCIHWSEMSFLKDICSAPWLVICYYTYILSIYMYICINMQVNISQLWGLWVFYVFMMGFFAIRPPLLSRGTFIGCLLNLTTKGFPMLVFFRNTAKQILLFAIICS